MEGYMEREGLIAEVSSSSSCCENQLHRDGLVAGLRRGRCRGGGVGGSGQGKAPGSRPDHPLLSSFFSFFLSSSPVLTPHTWLSRFSWLSDGGMRPSSLVKLVEWLGRAALSPAPGPLGRAGKVEQRPLALEVVSLSGGPFNRNSSLGENSGLAGGDWMKAEDWTEDGDCTAGGDWTDGGVFTRDGDCTKEGDITEVGD